MAEYDVRPRELQFLTCAGIYGEAAQPGKRFTMEVTEPISCPFCGQTFDLTIDTSIASQRFVTDCEICCRPFSISVEAEPGAVLSIQAE